MGEEHVVNFEQVRWIKFNKKYRLIIKDEYIKV